MTRTMSQLVAAGAVVCSLDALISWACLTYSTNLVEGTPFVADLIESWGMIPALSASALARIALLCLMAYAGCRTKLLYWPSAGALGLIVAVTAWTVWNNYQFLVG